MPGWMTVAATALPRGWREWLWWSWWTTLALLATGAAIVTEIASKRDASAARLAGQSGSLAYDAGWPFIYARVRLTGLDAAAWHAAIHGVAATAINWPVLVADCVLLAVLFNMWIALIVALWRVALRSQRAETAREMRQAVLTGAAVTAAWTAISVGIITHINQSQPTDAAAQAQIFQPLQLALLAPGVAGYGVQRWFESDAGPNISLTGGIANGVEAFAFLALAYVLPAALVTLLAVVGWRLIRARRQTEETMP
jgi:hypothetical protein